MWYSIATFSEWYDKEKSSIKNGFDITELEGRSDFISTFSGKITRFEPSTDAFSHWDLRVEKCDGSFYVVEIKKRTYPLEFLLKNGSYIEQVKFDQLQKDYLKLGETFRYIYAIKTSDNYWVVYDLSARFKNVVGVSHTMYYGSQTTVNPNSPVVYKQITVLHFNKKYDTIYNERGVEVCC